MRILLFCLILLAPLSAWSADLTCTVPTAAVSRAQELCELLRLANNQPISDWSNDACATEFLRMGLRGYEATVRDEQRRDEARAAWLADMVTFDANHPQVSAPHCGNSVVDTEFGEECDDGGVQTATCEDDCKDPRCGDMVVNAGAGEQCDDGNTQDGDGCSSTCQTE